MKNNSNLAYEFERLTSEEQLKIVTGLEFLQQNEIKTILIGGGAVVSFLNKNRNLTPDLDFICFDMNNLTQVLEKNQIEYSQLVDSNLEVIGICLIPFSIDVLDAEKMPFDLIVKIRENATNVCFQNNSLKSISIEMLILQKFLVAREKDINDAFLLLKSGFVDKNKLLNVLEELKETFQDDFETIKLYAQLIPV
jgi:predicted nucleotidyltransferase